MADAVATNSKATEKANLPSLDDPSLYINRELSWLEFNRRVLEEAKDPTVPLLERVKFLAIFASNLDEFFMVRVGGLQQKIRAGIHFGSGADRMPSEEQLRRISYTVRGMLDEAHTCLSKEILPALKKEKIVIRSLDELTNDEKKYLHELFRKEIFPVLTPLAIDPGHPFPHLLNKSINLAVLLQRPVEGERLFAVVQVPSVLPRFVALPAKSGHVFTALETVIRAHLDELFPGLEILQTTVFRVTRNSEYEIDDDDVEDLLKAIEEEVRKRRRGEAVRLALEHSASEEFEQFLTFAFDLSPRDVFRLSGILDLTGLFQICSLPGYASLRDPQFVPQPVPDFQYASDIWSAIRNKDILVHHPYESFSCVVDFIEEAAKDDQVLAIKQTLYRTSSDSPIIRALQQAAENGKQVTAIIELKARMDEERNILWAREMERSGVHVVFGFIGWKTHCKLALVVRREKKGIHRYVHLSTGNYNPQTARIYTDLSYFTCNPDFCEDASALFNYLTAYCEMPQWRKFVLAPNRMQSFILEKIELEIKHQQSGGKGRIIAKINGLLEPSVVRALYSASQAGVEIDLLCRGICSLRPQVPGISDNIRVISIVDRFLEHSRVYYFHNNGKPKVYIGSADLMDRNLLRRVEVIFPVEPKDLRDRLIDEILGISLKDNCKARELLPDGTYQRVEAKKGKAKVRSQQKFLDLAARNTAIMQKEHLKKIPIPEMQRAELKKTSNSKKKG